MPQNTKDSKGSKTTPTKSERSAPSKREDQGSAKGKSGAAGGSQNKGEKKTTP